MKGGQEIGTVGNCIRIGESHEYLLSFSFLNGCSVMELLVACLLVSGEARVAFICGLERRIPETFTARIGSTRA